MRVRRRGAAGHARATAPASGGRRDGGALRVGLRARRLVLGHLFKRAKVIAELALPSRLRLPRLGRGGRVRRAHGRHRLKQCALDVREVHDLRAALAQRLLELLEEVVIEVFKIFGVLDADGVECAHEALAVARLHRAVEPVEHGGRRRRPGGRHRVVVLRERHGRAQVIGVVGRGRSLASEELDDGEHRRGYRPVATERSTCVFKATLGGDARLVAGGRRGERS